MSPLNSYFLNGSPSEQRLMQDLVNEQLKMFGQDVFYMPRKFIKKSSIIKEEILSQFDDSFRLEAYITNVEGFGGQGDILSKFGVRTTDEITFIISKERFEDFISPFLLNQPDIITSIRPEEGDLIYLPLDNTLFEIKYVEGKRPFYQLNNLYVYELRCEVFEYEDEIIDTSIKEVDESVKEFGYIATISMVDNLSSYTATLETNLASNQYPSTSPKSVQFIDLINDGSGYLTTPKILISPPNGGNGITATALAIMTNPVGRIGASIKKILVTNPGIGYTQPPTITINSSSGSGGIATAVLGEGVLGPISITNGGVGYSTTPFVYVDSPPSGTTAAIEAFLSSSGIVSTVAYSNAGTGYINPPQIAVSSPIGISTGNYIFNEIVTGTSTKTTARVKEWDYDTKTLKVSIVDGSFVLGETIVGMGTTSRGSNASYKVFSIETDNLYDKYNENKDIEEESYNILDFSEKNPFAEF
jgi:hypothetical protein